MLPASATQGPRMAMCLNQVPAFFPGLQRDPGEGMGVVVMVWDVGGVGLAYVDCFDHEVPVGAAILFCMHKCFDSGNIPLATIKANECALLIS